MQWVRSGIRLAGAPTDFTVAVLGTKLTGLLVASPGNFPDTIYCGSRREMSLGEGWAEEDRGKTVFVSSNGRLYGLKMDVFRDLATQWRVSIR